MLQFAPSGLWNPTMNIVEAERTAADKRAQTLPRDAHERWLDCQSTHRFWAFLDKELVACRFLFGKPSAINSYVCKDLEFVVGKGLRSSWFDLRNRTSSVGQDPVELEPGCFLFHAGFGSLHTYLYRGKVAHRFSMLYRCRENPNMRSEGQIYLLERSVFDQIVAEPEKQG